ncbi:MAG: MmgE/PrpD family protein [Sporomusa sp.]
MTQYGISKVCANFVTDFELSSASTHTREHAKRLLLDWLGCAIKGASLPQAEPIRRYITQMGGNPQAQVIGENTPNSTYHAALANGYYGHILEIDDVDKESISHPGTVVIPAALSVGEMEQSSGSSFLAAVIAGYEVMLRVGAAVTPAHYQIWHTTATAGVFGAAAAAGKMLSLSREEISWALGSAGTMSAGLWEFLSDGAMSKYLHAGKASATGVMAAVTARYGLTGASRILEGEKGFFAGYARQEINGAIFEDFGTRYRLDTVSFKPYPCCRHTHSAIDCAIKLHKQCADALAEVVSIKINTYGAAVQVAGHENPQEERQAQFSLKYVVATALQNGAIVPDSFLPEALHSVQTRTLMEKTTVNVDSALDQLTPAIWPAKVVVTFAGGKELAALVEYPKGDPENTLTWEEVIGKFEGLVEGILAQEARRQVVEMCRAMEELKNCGEIIEVVNAHGKFKHYI